MNTIKVTILLFGMAAISVSCNNFLDTPSDNRTELNSEDKILQLLVSAYPTSTDAEYAFMSSDDADDVGTGYGTSSGYENRWLEAWEWRNITYQYQDSPNWTWEDCYRGISHANQALVAIENMGGPKTDKLKAAYGEAHVVRAYHYFRLAKVFCMPYYDAQSASEYMGIPYLDKPETTVNPKYGRGTLAEIYNKIDESLTEGLPHIVDTYYAVPKYHFNTKAAHAFAAEFYLYYKKFERAIECANVVLGGNAEAMLRDVSMYRSMSEDAAMQSFLYRSENDQANLLLSAGASSYGLYICSNYVLPRRFRHTYTVAYNETFMSPSIMWQTVSSNDSFIMPSYLWNDNPQYITRLIGYYKFVYSDASQTSGHYKSVFTEASTDNALLVRAEAYVMLEELDLAMADINAWRNKRVVPEFNKPLTYQDVVAYYGTYGLNSSGNNTFPDQPANANTGTLASYTPTAPTAKKKIRPAETLSSDQEAMIHAILHIRRIEFWSDGNRWQDIRRFNIEIFRRQVREAQPPATGVQGSASTMDYLRSRDPRYAIQIPEGVIAAGLTANPR